MLAAVFEAIGKPLRIERVPDPSPAPGELVVKVDACGICGSDLHAAGHEDGVFGRPLQAGTILGHELCGEVVDTGPGGNRRWTVGDRVAGFPIFGCGRCSACASGRVASCSSARFMGLAGAQGAFAEFARVDARYSVPIAGTASNTDAAMAEPLAVCLHATSLAMPVRARRVLILGAGPIGLLLAAVARHEGASRIVVSDPITERASRAVAMGADAGVASLSSDRQAALRDALGGRPDVVFDAAGATGTLETCLELAGSGGCVVVVAPVPKSATIDTMNGFRRELTVRFAKAYTAGAFAEACRLIETGAIRVQPAITDVVGFDGFPALFTDLARPNGHGKVLLAPFS